MTRPMRASAALLSVAMLVACGGDASSPTSSPTDPASPRPTAATDSPAPASPSPGTVEPSASPTGPAADFTCDLPIVDAGTAPIANIVDVRVGTHDGYDRFVIEFEQGTPELTLDRAEPPFVQDGSGFPVEVDGESFLSLVMRGGSKQTDAGASSYEGSTDFDTGFPMLVHALEIGDFERQSTWILGLTDEACVRMLLLDGPPRVVIDIER